MASSFPLKKNTAVRIVFTILDADGDPVSGAAEPDSEYSLDGGAFSDCTNEATEIGASGIYYLDLLAGETNGDVVCIQVKTTTAGAKTTVLVFYTAAQTLDETDIICDAIKAVTDALPNAGALNDLATILSEIRHATYGLSAIKILVDELETRLTAVRAGYLDELAAANIPADINILLTRLSAARALLLDEITAARMSELDAANIPADIDTIAGYLDTEIAAILAAVDTEVGSILAIANNLPDGGALTALLASIASILTDIDTTIPGLLATIQADLDNPDQYKADVTALALEATLTAIKGAGWTVETLKAIKDAIDAIPAGGDATEAKQDAIEAKLDDGTTGLANIKALIDAIKIITDALPDGGALNDLSAILTDTDTTIPGLLVTIQADLDNPDQYKADVAALALEATLTAIKGIGWTNETLKLIKELVDELETGEKPGPKARFTI